jgi:hypothetical protein
MEHGFQDRLQISTDHLLSYSVRDRWSASTAIPHADGDVLRQP